MTLSFIGAALVVAGALLLASMWLSSRGGTAASYRDPAQTRQAADRRLDEEPMRRA